MKATHLIAVAALTLGTVGLFACERDQDKDRPGTTRTTGATPPPSDPVDRSTAPQPPGATPRSDETATPSTGATGSGNSGTGTQPQQQQPQQQQQQQIEKKDAGHK